MDEKFAFELSAEEKNYLKKRVVESIREQLFPDQPSDLPEPPSERLREKFGAFVTLKTRGRLRGCIGHLVGDQPLYETVSDMALAAAFQDPRFAPLSRQELEKLEVEISVLGPISVCPDLEKIEVGRHGLIVRQGYKAGLLLPQVASEHGWDRRTFLEQTCAKAGLGKDAWQERSTRVEWFEAEVF